MAVAMASWLQIPYHWFMYNAIETYTCKTFTQTSQAWVAEVSDMSEDQRLMEVQDFRNQMEV